MSPPQAGSSRPTHARYWVIVFAVCLAMIQYVDKVCISQAAPFIQKDLNLQQDQMGWVFGTFTLVAFCDDIQLPGAWTACMDVGGKAVATPSGTMNMMGNVGGFVSPIVCGYIVRQTGNWNLAFYVTATAYVLGALCWLGMDPVTPLEQQGRTTRPKGILGKS
jgi:nitrate/nitrite transporter NarK